MCISVLAGVWTSVNQSLFVALRVCMNLGGMGEQVCEPACVCVLCSVCVGSLACELVCIPLCVQA